MTLRHRFRWSLHLYNKDIIFNIAFRIINFIKLGTVLPAIQIDKNNYLVDRRVSYEAYSLSDTRLISGRLQLSCNQSYLTSTVSP